MAVTERERPALMAQPVVPRIEMWRALRSNVRAIEAAHDEARQREIASRERLAELAAGLYDGSHRLWEFITTNREATVAAGLESQVRVLAGIADQLESSLRRVDVRFLDPTGELFDGHQWWIEVCQAEAIPGLSAPVVAKTIQPGMLLAETGELIRPAMVMLHVPASAAHRS